MPSLYGALADLENENQAGVLCTIVRSQGSTPRHTTAKMLVYPDSRIIGTVGGGELENRVIAEALQALAEGAPRLLSYRMSDPSRGDPGVCGGQVEVFVEPIMPKPTLLIVGSGHVGKAVAHLADWLGFHIVVSDDRPGFCTPEVIPEGKEFLTLPLSELAQNFSITPWTYIVLTTRGVAVDITGLPALLDTPAAYIGVIGSRRRWETTRKAMLEAGVAEEKIRKVHSPIGIELNAETPEEIAVSIMAEIIMVLRGGSGEVMSAESALPAHAE
jgi:xanthine dehydrogenase accessory factor